VSEVIHFYEAVLAVSAIVIWHLFYVIFMPSEYPMSTIWINGRMPASEWKEMHSGEYFEVGERAVRYPSDAPDKPVREEDTSGVPVPEPSPKDAAGDTNELNTETRSKIDDGDPSR
jgi:hypothetical protein